ncbi:Putative amino acid transporter OS=Streptomyces ambofaciens ATCC 23877 GN=SAMR0252 PE=4 SV=1 [Gemmata massiliana]|uniref:Amino acid transporter n=1 Tax=Gemmata massiliana TaxID=1210884 RepID=A0A6P2DA99_9BACT|nr:amino acid transporter [Gemmata massiliana]VTR97285.1 Putative amino acid transporter OS=Streptomyces ambofaciens ATCC 23877 GN=SAMR0252 PE=4 SV=1 [Gemmata massiliana]
MPAPDVLSGESAEPPSSRSEPPSRPGEPPDGSPPQPSNTNADPPVPAPAPFRAAWPWVLCVIGLDYLSTLAYQPSIAFGAAGRLAPLVTVLIALVTLGFALPVYCYIAGRSPHGGGSTALLERVVPGWFGKLLLLVLLAFGAVDLVFTRTFSTATAAEHLTFNPHPQWQQALDDATRWGDGARAGLPDWAKRRSDGLWHRQTVVSLVILVLSTATGLLFFRGYTRNFIRLAALTVLVYLAMTLVVIGSGVAYLVDHPKLIASWWADVWSGNWKPGAEAPSPGGWGALLGACIPLVPALCLGLSGFELTLMAMPLVRGRAGDDPERPHGVIRNTRLLLTLAAVTMSAYLLTSTLVTTVLIPPGAQEVNGQAKYRSLAYLAHGGTLSDGQPATEMNPVLGLTFGTAYDAATVAILALAGLSFALTLASWIPPYLNRLGMEFSWSVKLGVLAYLFLALKFVLIAYYATDIDAHRAAYLTAVLALFAFAALAATVDVWQRRAARGWRKALRVPPVFLLALATFGACTILVAWTRPVGAVVAGAFVALVLVLSVISRAWRSTEFRFEAFEFADKVTEHEWERLMAADLPILVPLRPGKHDLRAREIEVRTRHRIPGTLPIMFVLAEVADPSDFNQRPLVRIAREEGRVVIHITRCCSVAHAVAACALELAKTGGVPEVHFGWSVENPVTANLHFVLFGIGNVPWMVYTLIRRADVPDDRKPHVIVA